MKKVLSYISLLYFLPALSQDYNFIHYDTREGLAGSTVYRICEGQKGYLWFATDHGLSRFDGKKFTNFTTEHGLTDNEVMYIDSDSKGRLWITPFNKTVCYYYNGKIYNASNDSLLKNIHFTKHAIMGKENRNGDIYFHTDNAVLLYKKNGEFKTVADYQKIAKQYSLNVSDFLFANIQYKEPYSLVLFNGPHTFMDVNDSFVYYKKIIGNKPGRIDFYAVKDNFELKYPQSNIPRQFNSVSNISTSEYVYHPSNPYMAFNTPDGSWIVDSAGKTDPHRVLVGKNITQAFRDSEGNVWFSTIGDGVYRLTSWSTKTFENTKETLCLAKANGRTYAGLSDGSLLVMNNHNLEKTYPFKTGKWPVASKRLYALKTDSSGVLYMGYDAYFARLHKGEVIYSPIRPIKSIDIVDKDHIVVCTNFYTLKLKSDNLEVVDTLWNDRGTKVVYDRGNYYIGTLNGLVVIGPDKTVTKTTNIQILNKRIVDICKQPSGGVWIATNDNGVVLYKNGRIDSIIDMKHGLSSNICKSLHLQYPYLWIGTTRGINKLDTRSKKIVAKYSISDGLASDIVNAICSEDSIVWLASPSGLSYFNEKDISSFSICKLDLNNITVSGRQLDPHDPMQLSYKDNNISFDYIGISFRSAGEIIYRYKLDGLDNDWKETSLTTLAYPALPPGNYTLQLYAVNKFGKQSDTATIVFSIAAPFWKTIWFWIAISLLVLGIISYLFSRRYKRLQKNIEEKNQIARRMTELEQASLRAQMNPHFVFNCLNSIQYFVLKNDIEQTNRYITQFANLIRQTLNNSARASISLADEKNYLTSYLELEKMRSTPGFDYSITSDPAIDSANTFIPSMLLQPFVENAIKHGVRLKKGGNGMVRIDISPAGDLIQFSIEDNGPGRQAAGKYKLAQPVEYQSKGTALTLNRIEVLNSISQEKIIAETIDLQDDRGAAAGTRVIILFPMSVVSELNGGMPYKKK